MNQKDKKKLALKAYLLAIICADRKHVRDAGWEYADAQLKKIADEVNREFAESSN